MMAGSSKRISPRFSKSCPAFVPGKGAMEIAITLNGSFVYAHLSNQIAVFIRGGTRVRHTLFHINEAANPKLAHN